MAFHVVLVPAECRLNAELFFVESVIEREPDMSGRVVELSERWTQFFQKMIYEWRYEDETEVVEVALQLFEQCATDPKWQRRRLNALVQEGIEELDAGQGTLIESDADLAKRFEEINSRTDGRLGKIPRT